MPSHDRKGLGPRPFLGGAWQKLRQVAFLAAKKTSAVDFCCGLVKPRSGRSRAAEKQVGTAPSSLGERVSAIIYIVDDDASFRTALRRQLQATGYRVVTYELAEQVLQRPPNENEPGCILLDVQMPGLSGPALHSRLLELRSALPILFLTGYADVSTSVKAIKAGADDFLMKPVNSDELLRAIERALARHQAALEERREVDVLRSRFATLTQRERQVFALIVHGKMNKQVAHELGTVERTVKAHRGKVMQKMGARSLLELVSFAERLGVSAREDFDLNQRANLRRIPIIQYT
jgi:FixJ family two-component response regulator